MACVLTLGDGKELYTLTRATGYVWGAIPPKDCRFRPRKRLSLSLIVLLMLLKVQIFFSKVIQ